MGHAALVVAVFSLASLSSGVRSASASEPTLVRVVVTFVDQDIYQASPDPNYNQGSSQMYLRTARCTRRSDREPTVLALDHGTDRAWLVFHDDEMCEVVDAARDRGGL